MPVEAKGWLTGDGVFFDSRSKAEFHEAEIALIVQFQRYSVPVTWPLMETFLQDLAPEIRRYLDAYEASHEQKAGPRRIPYIEGDTQYGTIEVGDRGNGYAYVADPDPTDGIAAELAALRGEHSADNGTPEGRSDPVLQQPVGGSGSVSEVRGGERAEAISNERSGNGVRSGSDDASSVRSSSSVAVEDDTATAKTLESGR